MPGCVRSIPYLLAEKFHRLAFEEWGDSDAATVVCVHGLTRNGRDFEALATARAGSFRVICVDLPGRGYSDWLDDPTLCQAQYNVMALGHVLAWIGRDAAWIGTSLGGTCGMIVAAILLPETVERMKASGALAYEVPLTAHAPALLDPVQIELIRSFLTG
jgi:pimeloyl-ACP methyl ester carboxylesterase